MTLIKTSETDCRDCYRCIRVCPVKAIQIQQGRAMIQEEMCIADGQCVLACPQEAKSVQDGLEQVQTWRDRGLTLIASLAPSFVAAFPDYTPEQVAGALEALGFSQVQETAIGAEIIAPLHSHILKNSHSLPLMTSACPVVVRLVERYYPHLVPNLIPLISPLIAHGRTIKAEQRGAGLKVIFIGPCVGKKQEIAGPEVKDAVDEALTFRELHSWWEEEGIDPAEEKGTLQGNLIQPGRARHFPIDGGLFRTFLPQDLLEDQAMVSVSGLEELQELFNDFPEGETVQLIEAMACKGGCINGPGMPSSKAGTVQSRSRVLCYAHSTEENTLPGEVFDYLHLQCAFTPRSQLLQAPKEEVLQEILSRIGKKSAKDELNCGACGYTSCREKAIAYYHGLAELEMCMPFMRTRAESFAEAIIEHSPNGVLVLDTAFRVQSINVQAETMFNLPGDEVKGMALSLLLPVEPYEEAWKKKKLVTRQGYYPEQDVYTNEYMFPLPEQEIIVGLYNDVTRNRKQGEKLAKLKKQTLEKTEEVIHKQMRIVQEIAGLLGETTAETKVSLGRMVELFELEE